jgi:hypothetical protein
VAEQQATLQAPPADAEAAEAPAATEVIAPREAKAPAKEKKKGKKKAQAPAGEGGGPSVAAHPRAARSVERAKGWGALLGFLLGGYESLPTHTLAVVGLRALVAGVVLYLAAWGGSLFFWRRMLVIEIKAREQQLLVAARAATGGAGAVGAEAGGAGR